MYSQSDRPRIEPTRKAITAAANDNGLTTFRYQLAKFCSSQLDEAGTELHVLGHIIGSDRASGVSPFEHGNDETVAGSVLLRVASQLISASADLFADGRHYAAAALLRQMVEIEYLAWAFETRDGDAERWLRSSQEERLEVFKPAKLRAAAQGKFRGKDGQVPHPCSPRAVGTLAKSRHPDDPAPLFPVTLAHPGPPFIQQCKLNRPPVLDFLASNRTIETASR